jgi:energy-coupling factor transporter ATP-binding protein EcfA2
MSDPFDVSAHLDAHAPNNSRYHVVAIDGRGGSGKTQLASHLAQLLPAFTVINGDDYFEPLRDELAWGDFNEERFHADVVLPLQQGEPTLSYQPYDFARDALQDPHRLPLDGGLTVERCFTFGMPVAWDLRIWVETPRELCLQRGLARDLISQARAAAVWERLWQPREDAYIDTLRPQTLADVVLDGTRPFEGQLR